jgi:signal transduction histidine kinase/streptogramin lyase
MQKPRFFQFFIILSVNFWAIGLLEGQKSAYKFEHFGVDEGLSQGTVREIFPDSRGYLWLSTTDGLNRFDGNKFEVFRPILGDSTSLAGVREFEIIEDSESRIWISHEVGLSRFDYQTRRFCNFFHKKTPQSGEIKWVATDQMGGIWTISQALKLTQWDRKSLQKRREIDLQSVNSIELEKYQSMVIFQDSSFAYLNLPHQTLKLDLKTGQYQLINSAVFAAQNSSQPPFFFPKKNNFAPFPSLLEFKPIKASIEFEDIIDLDGNRRWFSNKKGLFEIKKNTRKISHIFNQPYCSRLVRDKNNHIWVGTETQGIFKFSPSKIEFETFKMPTSPQPLIMSVVASKDSNQVFVGTFDGFLAVFDRKKGFQQQFKVGKYAFAVCPFAENQVLVIDFELNLKVIDLRNGRVIQSFGAAIQEKLGNKKIAGEVNAFLIADEMGRFLFRSKNILLRITPKTNGSKPEIEILANFGEETTLKNAWFDHQNRLWIAGNLGAYVVDYPSFSIKKIDLPNTFEVRSFSETKNGQIWVATTTGLLQLDKTGVFLKKFDTSDGLANQYIYGILSDAQGRFWVSSNHGLMVFNPENPVFQNFTVKDGLQGNEFNGGSFCALPNGWLAFAGTGGLNIFDPTIFGKPEKTPTVVLTEWRKNDQILPLLIEKQTFRHYENQFGFQFKSCDLTNSNGSFFRFRLIGFESEWQLADAGRTTRYTNLLPGNYQFEVQTARPNQIWGASTFSAPFEIEAAFWNRWWFYFLEILVFSGILLFIFNYFAQKKLEKQRAEIETQFRVQAERVRISRDLHDNVGAQLSTIVHQVENLADLTNRDQSKEISQVRESAKTAIFQLRETIWAIHKDQLSGEDLADKIKSWTLQQTRHRPEIDVLFDEKLTENIHFSPTEALQIFRICQESLHNSLKYAKPTKIHFLLSNQPKQRFYLKISDNGVGFEQKKAQTTGYGLQNMRERAAEIGAKLEILSTKNIGTSIEIEL